MTFGRNAEQVVAGQRTTAAPLLGRLLRDLQVELLDAAPIHARAVIDAQLGRVGAALGAVRVLLWRVEPEGDAVAIENEWFRDPLVRLGNPRVPLDQFPIGRDVLLGDGPGVVLDSGTTAFFDAAELLVVPLSAQGRLLRFLVVAWADPTTFAGPVVDQAVLDSLYSLTAVAHGAAERAQLAERASYDEQTGLANRRLLLFVLNHLLSRLGRRGAGGVAVIFCEVTDDGVTEDVMLRVARAFQRETRATDVVGRFDDRILAVLCDDLRNRGEAIEVARRLAAVCHDLAAEESVTARLGIGYSDESVAPGVLLRRADLATYQARSDGVGAIRVVSE